MLNEIHVQATCAVVYNSRSYDVLCYVSTAFLTSVLLFHFDKEHGLLVVGDEDENDLPEGQRSNKRSKVGTIVVVSPEAAELLEVAGDGPLDVRLKHFVEERKQLLEEVGREYKLLTAQKENCVHDKNQINYRIP